MKKCKAAIKGCHPDGWPAGRPMKVEELSTKQQAASNKQQAALILPQLNDNRIIKDKLC